ncbi:MAG: hypothetical protein H6977_04790 [Gammaproteobacteria bacterium]|nr:hypothetical protein [Gammaproteobacteria bacterium]MCP5199304.1 hypothetical protein [Gammaproteobacteria bacterium]
MSRPTPRPRRRLLVGLAIVAACGLVPRGLQAAADAPLTDPTRPPLTHESALERRAVTEPESFTVTAIRISPHDRRALVNDQLVGIGDRVGAGRVVEITPGAVVIEYLSERNRIALLPARVRRTAAAR